MTCEREDYRFDEWPFIYCVDSRDEDALCSLMESSGWETLRADVSGSRDYREAIGAANRGLHVEPEDEIVGLDAFTDSLEDRLRESPYERVCMVWSGVDSLLESDAVGFALLAQTLYVALSVACRTPYGALNAVDVRVFMTGIGSGFRRLSSFERRDAGSDGLL